MLDPGQPQSNSAAGLRSNLFATQSIITHKKQAEFTGFKKQRQYNLVLENVPAFKGLMQNNTWTNSDGFQYKL